MSFDTTENSEQAARPALLFKFFREGKAWFYSNMDQTITFEGDTYAAFPIVFGTVVQTGASALDEVRMTLPRAVPLCQYLDLITPSSPINLIVRKVHMLEDASDGSYEAPGIADTTVVWVGAISGINRPTPSTREFVMAALQLGRNGLRLSWTATCTHTVYNSRGCKVDKSLFVVELETATLDIVDGVTIAAPEFELEPSGWFSGGFLEWESEPGVVERRGLEVHTAGVVTVFGNTAGIAGGDNYKIYPGCGRTPDICATKFGNLDNYGGIRHLAGKSPFDGDPVF